MPGRGKGSKVRVDGRSWKSIYIYYQTKTTTGNSLTLAISMRNYYLTYTLLKTRHKKVFTLLRE